MMLDSSFMLHTLADAAVSRGWGSDQSCTGAGAGPYMDRPSGPDYGEASSSQACVAAAWGGEGQQGEMVILSGEELTICTEADEVTTTTSVRPAISLYPTVSPFSSAPRKRGALVPPVQSAPRCLPPENLQVAPQKAAPCDTAPPPHTVETPPSTAAPCDLPSGGAPADTSSSSDSRNFVETKPVIEGKFKPFKGVSFATVYSSPALEKSVWDQIFLRGSNVDLPDDDEDVWGSSESFEVPTEFTYLPRLTRCSQKEDSSIRKIRVRKHSKTKSKTKSFQCSLCEYCSPSRSNLKRHAMVNHSEDRPFKCPQCEYASADASNFKMHKMVKHSKLRPCRCAQCEFSCATRSQLRKHVMAKHSSVRPFRCSQCSFSTVYSCGLKKHVLSQHSSVRAFQCSLCQYASARKDKLRSHIKAKHPDL